MMPTSGPQFYLWCVLRPFCIHRARNTNPRERVDNREKLYEDRLGDGDGNGHGDGGVDGGGGGGDGSGTPAGYGARRGGDGDGGGGEVFEL